jgi:hypothetical protein
MTRISPMDLSFLLLENASRPLRMAAFTMFQKPKGQQSTFGPTFGKMTSANLVISNMKGPTGQLYLAGAPMVVFTGLPILPPGAGLNVTFASVNTDICLAIGAAPEAVHEPFRLAQLIEQAFHRLQADAGRAAPRTAPASVSGTSTGQHRTRRTP